jgi:glycosyltransferase involved in cell wall biosynthesis
LTPLRLLALHASDELYGSDRVFCDLIAGLDRSRFRPVVVLPNDVPGGGRLSERLRAAGVPVHQLDLGVLRRRYMRPDGAVRLAARVVRDSSRLAKLAREVGCHLVYTSTTAVQGGALAARRERLPHVWHVHEIIESPRPVASLLRTSLGRLSTEVIVPSRAVASWVGPTSCPVTVAPYGLSEPRPTVEARESRRADLLAGRRGPLVGFVGRISSWKGHEVFVEMAERAANRHPDALFVLAGGAVPGQGDLVKTLRERLLQSPHADRIRYLGEVADGPGLVAALDVLVACPTRPDPFPRVVEEALWHGVPVVAVRTGGLPELVNDGRTGRVVSAADPALLATALDEVLAPEVLASMGRNAAHEASTRFSMPTFLDTIGGVLERATDRTGVA